MTFLCVRNLGGSRNELARRSTSERLCIICRRNESSLVSLVISMTYVSHVIGRTTLSMAPIFKSRNLYEPAFTIGFSLMGSLTFGLCFATCWGRTMIPMSGLATGASARGTLPYLTLMISDSATRGRSKLTSGTYSRAIRGQSLLFIKMYCCANARAAYTVGRSLPIRQYAQSSSHPWRSIKVYLN